MLKRLSLCLLVGLVSAQPAMSATQDEKISDIVEMLQDNPEVIDGLYESLGRYVKQQQQFSLLLESSKTYLNDPMHSFLGAENPELTVINVTDYSCPYCKKLDLELQKLVKAYPQIKVINLNVSLKESTSSVNSSAYALNVWQNDKVKYQEVHNLLVSHKGSHTPKTLEEIAKQTQTQAYLPTTQALKQQLENNYVLFNQFGLRGTPALIVGQEVVPGYMPYEQLEQVITQHLNEG